MKVEVILFMCVNLSMYLNTCIYVYKHAFISTIIRKLKLVNYKFGIDSSKILESDGRGNSK